MHLTFVACFHALGICCMFYTLGIHCMFSYNQNNLHFSSLFSFSSLPILRPLFILLTVFSTDGFLSNRMRHEHFPLRLRESSSISVFSGYHVERLRTAQHAQPGTTVSQAIPIVQYARMEPEVHLVQRNAYLVKKAPLPLRYGF